MTVDLLAYPGAELALKIANRVLADNAWAAPRLQGYAGRTAEIHVGAVVFRLRITDAGSFTIADDTRCDVLIRLNPVDLPLFLVQRKVDARKVSIEGDATFASELSAILENLSLDKEEWLSRLTGDIVAHRIGRAMDAGAAWPAHVARRFLENIGEYATEEARWVAQRRALEAFATGVDALRDDVARLEKRIERLVRKTTP